MDCNASRQHKPLFHAIHNILALAIHNHDTNSTKIKILNGLYLIWIYTYAHHSEDLDIPVNSSDSGPSWRHTFSLDNPQSTVGHNYRHSILGHGTLL